MFGWLSGATEEPPPPQRYEGGPLTIAQMPREPEYQQQLPPRPLAHDAGSDGVGIGNFPYQVGGASAEMCNALVAAAGDPACSDMQRRRRVLHCLDLGVPVDHEDPDGAFVRILRCVTRTHAIASL
eukprot:8464246-Pyramimonas_sp.AAC.1